MEACLSVFKYNTTSGIGVNLQISERFLPLYLYPPSDGMMPGLQSRYLLEKCVSTLSLSCVSPIRANCLRNALSEEKKHNGVVSTASVRR